MNTDAGYLYQVYEIQLNKAVQQERSGKLDAARRLYLQAAESLAKIADANTGQVHEDQIKDAAALFQKAKSLKPVAKVSEGSGMSGQKSATQKTDENAPGFTPSPVPDLSFEDIAGLEDVKREVRERIIQPMNNPDLYRQFKIKPGGGILMFGLPGTGKTMIARAIAHEVNAPFYHIRSSDLKDKWVGSSERNIAALFERVRQEKACVIFFDEFEGLGGKAYSSTHMRGALAELKSQMDGFEKDTAATILLLAATNHPWEIDTAFVRAGRFSKMIYIPLPDEETRSFLVRQQLSDVPVGDEVDMAFIVSRTGGVSGADVVQLCYQMKIRAATRSAIKGTVSFISAEDVEAVMNGFRSTVVPEDIQKMKVFMQQNGCVVPERM